MSFEAAIKEKIERDLAATYALLQNYSKQMENYGKGNAPWADRTAHARQSLHSDVQRVSHTEFRLYFAHGKDYGLILEDGSKPHPVPNAFGRGITIQHPGTKPYPIIEPTMAKYQPRIFRNIRKLWST